MNCILCCDKNWGIGRNNSLMFNLPKDLLFFKKKTEGRVIVMGANTLESLPGCKPLKNRINIVLSSHGRYEDAKEKGYILVKSLDELFEEIRKYDPWNVYIIGGAQLYKAMLSYCEFAYVTKVDAFGNADVFFDNLDENPDWTLVHQDPWIEDNNYLTSICLYRNSKNSSTKDREIGDFVQKGLKEYKGEK